MQHSYDFFSGVQILSVLQTHPVGPDRQSYTEYITCICEAFAKQQRGRGCGIANVLLVQRRGLGSAVSYPSVSGRSPALNDICCILG